MKKKSYIFSEISYKILNEIADFKHYEVQKFLKNGLISNMKLINLMKNFLKY